MVEWCRDGGSSSNLVLTLEILAFVFAAALKGLKHNDKAVGIAFANIRRTALEYTI